MSPKCTQGLGPTVWPVECTAYSFICALLYIQLPKDLVKGLFYFFDFWFIILGYV